MIFDDFKVFWVARLELDDGIQLLRALPQTYTVLNVLTGQSCRCFNDWPCLDSLQMVMVYKADPIVTLISDLQCLDTPHVWPVMITLLERLYCQQEI